MKSSVFGKEFIFIVLVIKISVGPYYASDYVTLVCTKIYAAVVCIVCSKCQSVRCDTFVCVGFSANSQIQADGYLCRVFEEVNICIRYILP